MPVSPEDRERFLPAEASADVSAEPKLTVGRRFKRSLHAPFDLMAAGLAQRGVHPLTVTGVRLPMAALGVGLHQLQPVVGLAMLVAQAVADILDGKVARMSGKTTAEGAVADALTDKVINATLYLYVITQIRWDQLPLDVAVVILMGLNASLDILSQRLRGPLWPQFVTAATVIMDPQKAKPTQEKSPLMANDDGKIKAHFQFYGVMSALLAEHLQVLQVAAAVSFAVGVVFAGRSIAGRLRKT